MAKSGKPTPKKNIQEKKAPVTQAPAAPRDWLPDSLTPKMTKTQSYSFWGLAALGLLVMIVLSLGSGINADDKFQCDYSKKLVNYYGTFGKDTAALNIPDGNMHLYGGFFEIVTGFANKALGFDQSMLAYHQVRNVTSATLAWVAMLCTALLAYTIAGWQAGLFTLILMLVSPRFVGDGFMNPKDIPFAAGYMMALYNMVAVLNRMPNPRRWNLIGLAAGLAIALAIRAGGLLSFAILFLFAGLHFLLKNGGFSAFSNSKSLSRYLLVFGSVAVAGYLVALLFWPFALQKPFSNPFVALSKFSDLEVKIRVLFEGENTMSDKTPWYYPLKWIFYTIPLGVIVGFFGSLLMAPRLMRHYNRLWIALVFFAGIFPVFYVIYKNSVIHDGWRHLTFAYPPIALAAGLFWNELTQLFQGKKPLQYAVMAAMGLSIIDAAAFIGMNPQYPYVYFNPMAGGIKGAFGKYETDYWGISTRQGIEWLEKQGILRPDMQETVIIATNMYYSTRQLTAKYGDKVKIKYLKWEKRCDDAWDYALYPTRFLDGATLQKGFWPPDNTVHMVQANGVPLLAVLKDNGRNCALGMAAMKVNDLPNAIELFKKELANVPDNDLAWVNLAQCYINSNLLEEAKAAANKALEISPDDAQANNLIGMYWMYKEDAAKAKAQFELSIKREASNPSAWYYLAIIAKQQNDTQTALNDLMKAIQIAPNFRPAYEMSAQIYEATGNPSAAQQFRAALGQMK
ncbi:MAG: tetratricopeptide repeat protein [Bacteroidetes bacterium]|nr:tetratricopeptide repeat protein [Bacteroidota bacterium]